MGNSQNLPVPTRGGGIIDVTTRNLRLIWRLLMDKRVNPFIKILPIGALVYFIAPDLLPLNPIDDAVLLWLGSYLFLELCPQELVEEHRRAIDSIVDGEWRESTEEDIEEG
ncbi:MAG: hypothetical protein JXA25_14810 [Anaerolineales bacterium]|nr:hypothetical protein [Anaerolineales bacterium]